jgi:hypothetical protein
LILKAYFEIFNFRNGIEIEIFRTADALRGEPEPKSLFQE